MPSRDNYVLDANVFIEAYQRYYAFGICAGFWHALAGRFRQGRVASVQQVKRELLAQKDRLSDWARRPEFELFFKQTSDTQVMREFARLMHWVQAAPQFTSDAKAQFADAADGWVVAFASISQLVVVTQEELSPFTKRTIPIPNLCQQFNVRYCNTFQMLRSLDVRFGWKKKRPPS